MGMIIHRLDMENEKLSKSVRAEYINKVNPPFSIGGYF